MLGPTGVLHTWEGHPHSKGPVPWIRFAAICLLGISSLACEGTSTASKSDTEHASAQKEFASQERVSALEKEVVDLRKRLEQLSRRETGKSNGRPSNEGSPANGHPIGQGFAPNNDDRQVDKSKIDPSTRIGKRRWLRIAEFRDEQDLTAEEALFLVDLIQSERIALRGVSSQPQGKTVDEMLARAREIRSETDAKVAASLGDENGAKWRTFRESRWGKRR